MKNPKRLNRPSTTTLLLLIPAACSIVGLILMAQTDHGLFQWLWLFLGLTWLWIVFGLLAATAPLPKHGSRRTEPRAHP